LVAELLRCADVESPSTAPAEDPDWQHSGWTGTACEERQINRWSVEIEGPVVVHRGKHEVSVIQLATGHLTQIRRSVAKALFFLFWK
jgi:hypothetical protein